MYGTALNPLTNQPVRHLWVADASAGICRIDPDIDYLAICHQPQHLCVSAKRIENHRRGNGIRSHHEPALSCDQKQGIFQITYVAEGDNGNGLLDYTSLFGMGGNPVGAIYPGGQTGCALPGIPNQPSSVALDPDGNLWVGSKSASILRFNNPDAASIDFGTCASFIQVVATTPNNRVVNGLAWVGHDLWGASAQSAFVILNADTSCLIDLIERALRTTERCWQCPPSLVPPAWPATSFIPALQATTSTLDWPITSRGSAMPAQLPTRRLRSVILIQRWDWQMWAQWWWTEPIRQTLWYMPVTIPSGLGTAGAGRWFQTIVTAGLFTGCSLECCCPWSGFNGNTALEPGTERRGS